MVDPDVAAGEGAAPDVSVVVVSYNALDWLEKCLAAVVGHGSTTGRRLEVIVVDNASPRQEVRDYLATDPLGVRVIQLETNVGFGRACNLGIASSTGRYVMLLNPDAVVTPGAVDALVDFFVADPGRGLVGGRTLRPDGTLDRSSCWAGPTVWSLFCAATGLTSAFRYSRWFDPESMGGWLRDSPREVDIVTGCLLLTSRELWDTLGGFDPDFFMYGEDADLSLRAREQGWRPSVTPESVVVHAVGASSSDKYAKHRLLMRGKASLLRKRWSPPRRSIGLALLAAGVGLRAAAERVRGHRDGTYARLWAERREWLAGWPVYRPELDPVG